MKNLKYLSSLCEEKTTFSFRLMRFSHQKVKHSDIFESFLLVIEYLQLVSQIFLIYAYSKPELASTKLGDLTRTFTKAFDFGYIADHEFGSLITILTVIIFSALVVSKFILFFYILYIAIRAQKGNQTLIDLWRWAFHLQARILCFSGFSFWVGLFLSQQNSIDALSQEVSRLIKAIFWIFISSEYILTIVFEKYFTHALPTRDLLSSKTTTLMLLTLAQKSLIQVLNGLLTSDDITDPWIYTIIGLGFDLLRINHFFRVLPYYRSKALYLQADLLIMIFSFNLAAAVYSIFLSASDHEVSINFLLVVWILLILIGIIAIRNYLKSVIENILTNSKQKSPELLSHKVFLLKEFKDQDINQESSRYEWKTLLKGSISSNIKGISEIKENKETNSLRISYPKKSVNQFCIQYLLDLASKFPQEEMLKLYKAYFYAKKLKAYPRALRLLRELQKSESNTIQFNALLLLDDIQSILRMMYENSQTRLDVFTYTRSLDKVVKLKQEMHKQAQLKLRIYQEIQQSFPNLSYIFDTAQSIHRHRVKIGRLVKEMNETIPDYYLEPISLYAHYNLILNHLIPEYLDAMKKFSEKRIKYQKFFEAPNLCLENMFHQDTSLMIMTGKKEEICKITYASEKAKQTFDREPVGQYLYTFISPFIRAFYKKALTYSFETGEGMTPNAMAPVFVHNPASGYIMPTSYFLNIHPFIWEGLHYAVISRNLSKSKDFIFLSENGEIYAFTQNIAKKLGLASIVEANSSLGTKIEKICPELVEPDKAFSLIGRLPANQQNSEDPIIQNAKRIYDFYSTVGDTIHMTSLNANDTEEDPAHKEVYTFQCTIANRTYGTFLIKILALEEIKKKNSLLIDLKNEQQSPYVEEDQVVYDKQNTPLYSPKARNDVFSEEDELVNTRLYSESKPSGRVRKPFNVETEEVITSNRYLLPKQQGEKDSINQQTLATNTNNASLKKISSEYLNPVTQKKPLEIDNIDTYSVNSQRSASNTSLRKMKAFNSALTSNYYSRKYTIFKILLCVVVCLILIDQSILRASMDNYINNLKVRKDVVTKARTRSLKMMDLHRVLRVLWIFGTEKLLQTDIRSPGGRAPAQIVRMTQYVNDLSAANRDLRKTVDQLDTKTGQVIFQQDVRMYETNYNDSVQQFINMTNFEAADNIISTSLQILPKLNASLSSTLPEMNLMLRNIPNDILLQTEYVADVFISSLGEDMDDNINLILGCIWSIVVFLVLLFIALTYMLYTQYNTDKRNLAAVRTLDLDTIRTAQDRVQKFTQLIEEEVSFEGMPSVDIFKFYYRRNMDGSRVKKRKQEYDSTKSLAGIRRKYIFYAVKLFVFFGCIVLLICLNSVFSRDRTTNLSTQTNQLQIMNTLDEGIALLASIAADLVAENDETLILNRRPSLLLPIAIQAVSEGKSNVLASFEAGSKELDMVRSFFYEDNCFRLTPDMAMFCRNLTKTQQNAGFIYLTTYVESIFTDFKERFTASSRTSSDLKAFRLEVQTYIIPHTIAVQLLATIISQAVDSNLESSISSSLKTNEVLVFVFCFVLVLICILIYTGILTKVRESDNQFRRVLQVFPANVILSNFILKSYMLRAAKGTLDFIKNEL